MIMYHLYYFVENSENSYTQTEVFQLEENALNKALQLNQCDNVKIVTLRTVSVESIKLDILKSSDNCEVVYAKQ